MIRYGISGNVEDKLISDIIYIMNDRFQLWINVRHWFPESKTKVNQLLKLIYLNDDRYETGPVLDKLVRYLTDYSKQDFVNDRCRRRLEKNIEQIKIFNGLYGGM